ncbi:hypothetical protein D3C72_1496130 [compost metagenome]
MNVGKGLFRFIEQNQQQWNPDTGARQGQQQGIDLARRGKRQGVGHAQTHHPDIAGEIAQRRADKYPAAMAAEA